jgi:3',5'-cyclic AMP phosphodiesterase CpdA
MRLAVLSDMHGNLVALEAALADLEAAGEVDMTWVLGDLAAHGSRPAECVRLLRSLAEARGKEHFRIIGGNTDRYLVTGERFKKPPVSDEDDFARLASTRRTADDVLNWNLEQLEWDDYQFLAGILGKELQVDVPGYGAVIGYHAIPGDDEAIVTPDTPDEIAVDSVLDREGRLGIGGHIHMQMDRHILDWRLVNVGSVGVSVDMPGRAQWGLFTFEDGIGYVELRAVPYDVEAAVRDLQQTGHPAAEWMAGRLRS